MSEHTKGRLTGDVEGYLFDQENNCVACIGSWEAPIQTDHNTRRLAAAWNACEGMTTEAIEALAGIGSLGDLKASELDAAYARIEKLEALAQQQDTWLGKKTCAHNRCSELSAARALLREVLEADDEAISDAQMAGIPFPTEITVLTDRLRSYLHACDTTEAKC